MSTEDNDIPASARTPDVGADGPGGSDREKRAEDAETPEIRGDDGLPGKAPVRVGGRQRYLDPDRQPRYDGPAKVARTASFTPVAPQGPTERGAKEPFVRPPHRRPRPSVTAWPEWLVASEVTPRQPIDSDQGDDPVTDGRGVDVEGQEYVRLRVQRREGELALLDTHLVDGPLREATSFPAGFAYDVTLDGELLHAGAVPDIGVSRSFVDPTGRSGEPYHHITETAEPVFMVRIPAEVLTSESLASVQVRLFQLNGEANADHLDAVPLDRRFPDTVELVASRSGLPRDVLPSALRRRGKLTGQGAQPPGQSGRR